jgi:hypothetical protein
VEAGIGAYAVGIRRGPAARRALVLGAVEARKRFHGCSVNCHGADGVVIEIGDVQRVDAVKGKADRQSKRSSKADAVNVTRAAAGDRRDGERHQVQGADDT